MPGSVAKSVSRGMTVVVALALVIGLLLVAANLGWLKAIGIESKSHDSQVIRSIERTEEVALVSLAVQGIKEQKDKVSVAGWGIPGTSKTAYLKYEFDAKLGIDGKKVEVERSGENEYRVTVPAFSFIGYSDPTFEVAAEDGGVLSWTTPDIDKVEMVNEVLNDKARDKYLDENEDLLRDQTKSFYDRLILGIDPAAKTTYEFAS